MFRWMLLGHLAGLWLSLEEVQCDHHTNMNTGVLGYVRPLWPCCDKETDVSSDEHDGKKCSVISHDSIPVNVGGASDKQCICEKKDKIGGQLLWCCLCMDDRCSALCLKEEENSSRSTATTKFVDRSTDKTSPTTIAGVTGGIRSDSSIIQVAFAPTSSSKSTGQLGSYQILLILLVLLVVALIVVAMILIIRKRKFSRRSDVSMTMTNQNEAVSSGYERAVRENHYEPSAEGVPIYTELNLTQEPAPSNSTVYSSVQPTGEAVDMGKRVVYAELDKMAVAVSPIYSQPFDPEASAINTEYAEPFKPDDKSTATAQVPSQ